MTPVLIGFLLFIICFLVHMFIWRIKIPQVSSLVLILLFIVLPVLLFAGLMVLSLFGDGIRVLPGRLTMAESFLLYLALACTYVAVYPAIRAVSPSLDILLLISAEPGGGMTEEELKKRFTAKRLVSARVDDLMEYRFILEINGRYRLNPIGYAIVRVFIFYRRMLGLPIGGG